MRHPLLLTLFLIGTIINMFASGGLKDSVISTTIDELHFENESEKQMFLLSKKPDVNYLRFASISNNSADTSMIPVVERRFYMFFAELQKLGVEKMKDDKKMKLIYKKVHADILNSYEYITTFNRIFENGSYNCVTASTLFALILHKLQIPFEVKQSIDHVFINTYPSTQNILIETTNPVSGLSVYTEAEMGKFVGYLINRNIIDNSLLSTRSVESVFNEYFFSQKNVGLPELIAIQYSNNGSYLYNQGEFLKALHQFEKSYYLYPSESTKYMIVNSLTSLINNVKYMNETEWSYYTKYIRFGGNLVRQDNLVNEFSIITNNLLVEKSDTTLFKQAYNYVNTHIDDSTLRSRIDFEYYEEMGRFYALNGDFLNSYYFFCKAFLLQKENYQIKSYIQQSIDDYAMQIIQNEKEEEFDKVINILEKHIALYPDTRDDSKTITILLMVYLENFDSNFRSFEYGDQSKKAQYLKTAEASLLKFELLFQSYPDANIPKDQIGEIYVKPSAYYFKKNDKKRSKEYILRGLKIVPNNYRLQNALSMLN